MVSLGTKLVQMDAVPAVLHYEEGGMDGPLELRHVQVDDDTVEGEDWTATFSSETVAVGPSLQLTEVTIVFEGDEETLEPLVENFAQKAMRAGG